MISLDLAFAPVIALVMTVLVAAVYMNLGVRIRGMRLFGVVTAGTWAGGSMITPLGPHLWGVAWLPFCVAGLASAGLFVAGGFLSRYVTRVVTAQLDGLAFHRGLSDGHAVRDMVAGCGMPSNVDTGRHPHPPTYSPT